MHRLSEDVEPLAKVAGLFATTHWSVVHNPAVIPSAARFGVQASDAFPAFSSAAARILSWRSQYQVIQMEIS